MLLYGVSLNVTADSVIIDFYVVLRGNDISVETLEQREKQQRIDRTLSSQVNGSTRVSESACGRAVGTPLLLIIYDNQKHMSL